MNFTGVDINPLAVLTCRAKAGPYLIDAFVDKALELHSRLACDSGRAYYTHFSGQGKWFSASASIGISRIARCIEAEPDLWARRLFWVALAKVVRATCNSRMSTYKLHIKKSSDQGATIGAVPLFESVLERFISHLDEQASEWAAAGVLKNGSYTVTTLSYFPRGWLQTQTVTPAAGAALTTTYAYWSTGLLKTVTMPNASTLNYTYDDAHRLTDVVDGAGNKLHYVLDNVGNRTSEQVSDASGNLASSVARVYDALNRVQSTTGAMH